jgi:ABC-type lipoprotein export system ATPase subunit
LSTNGGNTGEPGKSSVGRLLEGIRRQKGLSLQEAARRTGVPANRLAGLENGNYTSPAATDHVRLLLRVYADYLGLDGAAEPSGIVEARGVYKSYRAEELTVHALNDVNLSIGRGEFVAVMGPSGCGKTTLLNTLSGLDEIDGGEVFIAGEPLHEMDDARRTGYRARHMGFVFQGFNLMPVLSAVENVELPLLVSGAGLGTARIRALEVLEQVNLGHRAHHRPNQLSGGQQQRVAIARALVNEPAIVWADEPTGNLDSDTSKEVLDLLLQLNRENGQTFVVVTHDPIVGELMDRIVQMEDGRIVG